MPDRNDDEIEVVKRVWGAAWRKSLDAARSAYQQAFDIAIKDPAIDQEFRRRFETALGESKAAVEVPIKLALALALRSGGRPSAKPRRPALVRARRHALLDFAEARWAEYLANRKQLGLKKGECKKKAAEEAFQRYGKTAEWEFHTIMSELGRERTESFPRLPSPRTKSR